MQKITHTLTRRPKILFEDIKIQHTVFALPFAFMAAFMAAEGVPPLSVIIWILGAMAGGRSGAMVFNRMVDMKFDRENPRTTGRALPSGRAAMGEYIFFLLLAVLLFEFSCYMLNPLTLKLSPIALLIIFGYSLTKRFTPYSHFFLGLALGIVPVGAWVAVREEISAKSVILMLAIIFWLAGLDIIYSCQDVDFDKRAGLFSFPASYGIERSLRLSSIFHIVMLLFLLSLYFLYNLFGGIYLAGLFLVTSLLTYEHSIVRPDDLSRVNVAFFKVNGLVSILISLAAIADIFL
ncbi:MAG: putative 4-hydroxybenzoate polyprenyltransferase [Nitrospinae bacterium]|nr:putative 4-hydroxybenzoate polyprenyltransferase [Nitrospinota bacterium]